MLSAISTLLFVSFSLASPAPRPRAALISLPGRRTFNAGAQKVFDKSILKRERIRISAKYGIFPGMPYPPNNVSKRAVVPNKPFDIQRRAGAAAEPLVDYYYQGVDNLYYGSLYVGTPQQATTVDFDTGSSDLWLPLSTCYGCSSPEFDSEYSSTFRDLGTTFHIQYQDGSTATGTVATDTVSVAGLAIQNQGFGAVTNGSGDLVSAPSAGLLGLGFPANAASGATPFFTNLVNTGSLASDVFSFYMSREGGSDSELCLGCVDSSRYSGYIDYYTLDASSSGGVLKWWSVPSDGFVYNDGGSTGEFTAIIDSGTTLIYIPTVAAAELYSQIPGARPAPSNLGTGVYVYPCSEQLGAISVIFGGYAYAIDSADFNLGAVSSGSSYCVGGIMGEDIGNNFAILGDEFMKNWYSVFDYSNSAVGFAKAI